ncbi:hypothetical protein VFPPC_17867 [Pochonia chlamydosporia 170]|uniref:Uncharacterized protein n=1 Tax=Pochonia chlamydosporia 170 TaxID=1380566 RepID=A0A219AQ68_METCM|nr:hypothetical protein VFPPC_17867 [Pochonia chlamydosporia 170]OWT42940.1 hypothetical protein VFPPC_17867 [Pochonia chlamydosporia 170]
MASHLRTKGKKRTHPPHGSEPPGTIAVTPRSGEFDSKGACAFVGLQIGVILLAFLVGREGRWAFGLRATLSMSVSVSDQMDVEASDHDPAEQAERRKLDTTVLPSESILGLAAAYHFLAYYLFVLHLTLSCLDVAAIGWVYWGLLGISVGWFGLWPPLIAACCLVLEW